MISVAPVGKHKMSAAEFVHSDKLKRKRPCACFRIGLAKVAENRVSPQPNPLSHADIWGQLTHKLSPVYGIVNELIGNKVLLFQESNSEHEVEVYETDYESNDYSLVKDLELTKEAYTIYVRARAIAHELHPGTNSVSDIELLIAYFETISEIEDGLLSNVFDNLDKILDCVKANIADRGLAELTSQHLIGFVQSRSVSSVKPYESQGLPRIYKGLDLLV